MLSEFKLIERLKKKIPVSLHGTIGIGDDAGVFSVHPAKPCLFTADTIVEGVDFLRSQITPEMAGRKALAVNLSDVAAMGGKPIAFTVALGIPPGMNEKWLERFYSGMIDLAKEYKTLCAGGDITRAKEFFASIALVGQPLAKPITRSGARKGDWIGVTGSLGGSILGHHYRFTPRLHEAAFLAAEFKPTAMIDISDGFLQDLGHILESSKAGAELDVQQIPISAAARKFAKGNPAKALQHALSDGEDFELIFTISSAKKIKLESSWGKVFPKVKLSWVGKITENKKKIHWVSAGKKVPGPSLLKKGYSHF